MMGDDYLGRALDEFLSEPVSPKPGDKRRCRLFIEVQATGATAIAAYRAAIREASLICLENFNGDEGAEQSGELIIQGGHKMRVWQEDV